VSPGPFSSIRCHVTGNRTTFALIDSASARFVGDKLAVGTPNSGPAVWAGEQTANALNAMSDAIAAGKCLVRRDHNDSPFFKHALQFSKHALEHLKPG
jgi:hypothetical protein